ncbi:MAG TPA: OmpA family protein [Saprospiraceae bacterium]|nr:OmpA family protein [Saprospiraceae bacterium]
MALIRYFILILTICGLFSCSFNQKIKDGESAFERKQFAIAITLLQDEIEETKNEQLKARKAFLLGKSNIQVLEYQEAATWFKMAVDLNYGTEALGNLASTYKLMEKYQEAGDLYRKIGQQTGRIQENNREALLCDQAFAAKQKKSDYIIEKIFENSAVSDYAPVIFDRDFLVFTSEKSESTGNGTYNWTGEKFSDLYQIRKNGSEIRKFDSAINTNANEGTAWFTKDGSTLYFTRVYSLSSGDEYPKLMRSDLVDGFWSEPEVLPFIQDKIKYGHPTLIENDSILVFSSDQNEVGGTLDLYYSQLFSDGNWSTPEKLPTSINTQGNEKFPTGDKDTLYFSSDYLPGLGGFDIFKTFLKADGSWSIPINMGYPINSGGDDFSFIVDYSAKTVKNVMQQGFFSSSRVGNGKDDIYRFKKMAPQIDTAITKETKPVNQIVYVTVKTFNNIFEENDNPNSKVVGKKSLNDVFIKIVDENDKKVVEGYTDNNGFYFTEIPKDKSLKIIGAKLDYLNATKEISTKNLVFPINENSLTINTELILDKIYADKEINLENIYYDYDKWDIKAEAKPTLDALVKILIDNPQINIQLSSHTDCRGTEEYNEELSQKRAQSVVDYLISKSISSSRLIPKGYGESLLIDNCLCESCTEEQHQTNRRTTFKIVKR